MASFTYPYRDDAWKIWFKMYVNGEYRGAGTWLVQYKHKSSAVRRARMQYDRVHVYPETGEIITYEWIVSQTNPWAKGDSNER